MYVPLQSFSLSLPRAQAVNRGGLVGCPSAPAPGKPNRRLVLRSGVDLGPHMPGGQPSSNFSPIALVYFCHQNRAVKLTVSIAASV